MAHDLHSRAEMASSKPRRPYAYRHRVHCSVEIEAEPDEVSALWLRLEDLPYSMDGVRRVKRVSERRVLWDVDIAGRQVVWEAEVIECEPGKRIVWESRSGAPNRGEVRFERLAGDRTRLEVDIEYEPRGLLERLGSYLRVVQLQIDADLSLFRRFVEGMPPNAR